MLDLLVETLRPATAVAAARRRADRDGSADPDDGLSSSSGWNRVCRSGGSRRMASSSNARGAVTSETRRSSAGGSSMAPSSKRCGCAPFHFRPHDPPVADRPGLSVVGRLAITPRVSAGTTFRRCAAAARSRCSPHHRRRYATTQWYTAGSPSRLRLARSLWTRATSASTCRGARGVADRLDRILARGDNIAPGRRQSASRRAAKLIDRAHRLPQQPS